MLTGVTSIEKTFTDDFFDKYREQHKNFQPILKAYLDDNNPALASQLRAALSTDQKAMLREYLAAWEKIDLKRWSERWDELKKISQNNIDTAKRELKVVEAQILKSTTEKKELFQNYAKNPANITHMTKNEPATTKPSGISSAFNKLKRF